MSHHPESTFTDTDVSDEEYFTLLNEFIRGEQHSGSRTRSEVLQIIHARMLTEVSRRSHELAAASGNNIELGGSPAAPMTPPQQLTLPGSISELTYRPGAFTRVLSESADAKLTQHTSTGKAGTSSIEDKKSALTSLLNISADNIGTRSISPDITQPPTYVNEVNKLLDLLNHAPAELTPETSRGTTTARSQDASDARKVVSWTEHTDALLRLLNIPFHRRCPR